VEGKDKVGNDDEPPISEEMMGKTTYNFPKQDDVFTTDEK
jgi:hypothetical protein